MEVYVAKYKSESEHDDSYNRGYKAGYEDAKKEFLEFHIGDEILTTEGAKEVIVYISTGLVYTLNFVGNYNIRYEAEVKKTGKTYPWLAEIMHELEE